MPSQQPIDVNALPTQAELDELQQIVTHTGASIEQLMHFRDTVLRAAAEKGVAATHR